jgi:hypothetical protein
VFDLVLNDPVEAIDYICRLTPRDLGVPRSILIDDITQAAQEPMVIAPRCALD